MTKKQQPTFKQAAVCFGGIFVLISAGIFTLNTNLHTLLIAALMWSAFHGITLGYSFSDIRQGMSSGINKGLGAIYIFILIGMLVAALIGSGTVSFLIYYGLKYLSPLLFLPVGLILCTLMSLATGTAWGTVATAGVVLLEIGSAMGIPTPIVAGVIISGASFGDKLSPVSDTTNLAAMSADSPLYEHIRVMSYTTIPSFVIALIVFSVIGGIYADGGYSARAIQNLLAGLDSSFTINFWCLLPVITLVALSQFRKAPEISMMGSIITAGAVAIALQGASLTGFLGSLQHGHQANTGIDSLNHLLSRGGIQSMMWTLSLSLIALALGGVLDKLGILKALLEGIIKRVKRTSTLIATTISTSIISNMCLSEAYLSIILGGQLYKDAYKKQGLRPSMLSRSLEEGATLSTGLIPWTTAGLFYAATLEISVFDYAPWALFNLINPVLSIGLALLGIGIFKEKTETELQPA